MPEQTSQLAETFFSSILIRVALQQFLAGNCGKSVAVGVHAKTEIFHKTYLIGRADIFR